MNILGVIVEAALPHVSVEDGIKAVFGAIKDIFDDDDSDEDTMSELRDTLDENQNEIVEAIFANTADVAESEVAEIIGEELND